VSELCRKVGLKVNEALDEVDVPTEGGNLEAILSHNITVVGDSDTVVFGTGGRMGNLSSTSSWLIGYAIARGKSVVGWLDEEGEPAILAWKRANPMLVESAFVVTSKESLEHALVTLIEAGREMVRKKESASH
jgi:nucleoside 2-deoxyribosyltransferase